MSLRRAGEWTLHRIGSGAQQTKIFTPEFNDLAGLRVGLNTHEVDVFSEAKFQNLAVAGDGVL